MNDFISRRKAVLELLKETHKDGAYGYLNAKQAENVIMALPAEQQWIPVTERLPEVGKTVLLACKEYGFNCCEYITTRIGIYNTNCGTILAWMPLPEPYKED